MSIIYIIFYSILSIIIILSIDNTKIKAEIEEKIKETITETTAELIKETDHIKKIFDVIDPKHNKETNKSHNKHNNISAIDQEQFMIKLAKIDKPAEHPQQNNTKYIVTIK